MLLNIGQPLTLDQLAAARAAPMGGYEVFQAPIFDTVTWPAAGLAALGTLDVFVTQSNDETVTNLKQPGTIPRPDKFHAKKIFLRPLVEQTLQADLTGAGRVRDLDRIIITSRSHLFLTPSVTNRRRGPIPLYAIGSMGGVIAEYGGSNNPAAATAATVVHPRLSLHGGYPFDFILDSMENIVGQFKAGLAQALTASVDISVELWGFRYQKAQ